VLVADAQVEYELEPTPPFAPFCDPPFDPPVETIPPPPPAPVLALPPLRPGDPLAPVGL
jgi:hypothetical protein